MVGYNLPHQYLGQWLNWQSTRLQHERLWVRFLPGLPVANAAFLRRFSRKKLRRSIALAEKEKKKVKKSENAIQRYFRETTGELRKVSWPTMPEARRLTWLVLVVMVIVGAFLATIDLLSSNLMNLVLGI